MAIHLKKVMPKQMEKLMEIRNCLETVKQMARQMDSPNSMVKLKQMAKLKDSPNLKEIRMPKVKRLVIQNCSEILRQMVILKGIQNYLAMQMLKGLLMVM